MYLYENCKYIESREDISKSDKHVCAVSRGIRLVLRNINTIVLTRDLYTDFIPEYDCR